jgi:hypothetical protein
LTRSDSNQAFASLKDENINKSIANNNLIFAKWDVETLDPKWTSHIDGAHAVIHLAGEGFIVYRSIVRSNIVVVVVKASLSVDGMMNSREDCWTHVRDQLD